MILGMALLGTVAASGHGNGYELLPPVPLGDRMVSLEVSSSQSENPDNPDRRIQFSLLDADTQVTIRDVTYEMVATKGGVHLFEWKFDAPDGILTLALEEGPPGKVSLEREKEGGFFEALLGLQDEIIRVSGAPLGTGGLYGFDIKISTAGSFSDTLEEPITYDVGLSVPQRTMHDINDPNFGVQQASVITYYDEIYDFEYTPDSRSVSFMMPFEWSIQNINETSVVHEEIIFPKAFGDILVPRYITEVNGVMMPDRVTTIDGFTEGQRIIHIVLGRGELDHILESQGGGSTMEFLLTPAETAPLSTVTRNGQFRIAVNWEPEHISSNSNTTFHFNITDVFLKDRPAGVDYELSLVYGEYTIASMDGTSSDSRDSIDSFEAFIPDGVSGPVTLQFDSLGGSSLASAGIPVVVNRVYAETVHIPEWVRGAAGWWSDGMISDEEFAGMIQYMVGQGAITVPAGADAAGLGQARDEAGRWSEGIISDEEFADTVRLLGRS